jgi:hypothetical protein
MPVNRSETATPTAAGQVVALARHAHEAAQSLHHEVVTGTLAIGTVLAEAGDRAVHEPRMLLAQSGVVQAVAGEIAHLEVLHENVALQREAPRKGLAVGCRDVEGDRSLAPVAGEVVGGIARFPPLPVAQERRPPLARVVAMAGTFDLDHLGAEVREVLRGPRPGEHACEIEDADAVEDVTHAMIIGGVIP